MLRLCVCPGIATMASPSRSLSANRVHRGSPAGSSSKRHLGVVHSHVHVHSPLSRRVSRGNRPPRPSSGADSIAAQSSGSAGSQVVIRVHRRRSSITDELAADDASLRTLSQGSLRGGSNHRSFNRAWGRSDLKSAHSMRGKVRVGVLQPDTAGGSSFGARPATAIGTGSRGRSGVTIKVIRRGSSGNGGGGGGGGDGGGGSGAGGMRSPSDASKPSKHSSRRHGHGHSHSATAMGRHKYAPKGDTGRQRGGSDGSGGGQSGQGASGARKKSSGPLLLTPLSVDTRKSSEIKPGRDHRADMFDSLTNFGGMAGGSDSAETTGAHSKQ